MNPTLTQTDKQHIKRLISYLTNRPDLSWINGIIDDYATGQSQENQRNRDEHLGDDSHLIAIGDILQSEFMLQIDWQDDIRELKVGLDDLLLANFGVTASLPNLRSYDDRMTLASDGVLDDFARALRKQGFTLNNIVSYSEMLWLIVYPTTAHKQIEEVMAQLGGQLGFDSFG